MNAVVKRHKLLWGVTLATVGFLATLLTVWILNARGVTDLNGRSFYLNELRNRCDRSAWLHPGELLSVHAKDNTITDLVAVNITNNARRSLPKATLLLDSKFAGRPRFLFARDGLFVAYGVTNPLSVSDVCVVGDTDGNEVAFFPCKHGLVEHFWVPRKRAWLELTYARSDLARPLLRDLETTNSRALNFELYRKEALGFVQSNLFLSLGSYPIRKQLDEGIQGKQVYLIEWNLNTGESRSNLIRLPHAGPADALLSPSGSTILWRFVGNAKRKPDGSAGYRCYSEFWVSSSNGESFQPIGKGDFDDTVEVCWTGDRQFAVIGIAGSIQLFDIRSAEPELGKLQPTD